MKKSKSEILFIRKKDDINIPYITVEIRKNSVTQVRGKNNCSPCEEVKNFIFEWSKKKNIEYLEDR